jgi:hypothetical protein
MHTQTAFQRSKLRPGLLALCLGGGCLLAPHLSAQQPASTTPADLGSPRSAAAPTPRPRKKMIGSDWQGAKKFAASYKGDSVDRDLSYEIVRVQRLAKDRVGMSVVVRMKPDAATAFYVPRGYQERSAEDPTLIFEPVFQFSLSNAQIVDEEGQKTFAVSAKKNGDPYVGTSHYSGALRRGGGAFMGVYFAAPPPRPPSADGKPQRPLTVSVLLPNAKAPIKGVVIPDVISQEP